MKTLLLVLSLVSATAICSSSTEAGTEVPVQTEGPLLLVANKSAATLTVLDAETLEVVATTTTGTGPHEVAVTPDGRWAFVANYEGDGDSISRIDLETLKETERIAIDPYRQPHGIVVSADGETVYATVEGSRAVMALDVETGTVREVARTDQAVTHMLVVTPDEQKLYTANIGSGTVTVIDIEAGEAVKQIATGAGAEGIDLMPDGSAVWVTNRAADTVSIVDTDSDEVVDTLEAPGFPIRVKITPDGRYALVSLATANAVRVFDVATREVVADIDVGAVPVGVLVEPDGRRAFVANTQADTITVLDLETMTVATQIRDFETPDGMAYVAAQPE